MNSVSNVPAIELLAEAANTVMMPTSATPIISIAAVRAVRFGFRVALRVASSPLSSRRRSGSPNTSATGPGEHGINALLLLAPAPASPASTDTAPTSAVEQEHGLAPSAAMPGPWSRCRVTLG